MEMSVTFLNNFPRVSPAIFLAIFRKSTVTRLNWMVAGPKRRFVSLSRQEPELGSSEQRQVPARHLKGAAR